MDVQLIAVILIIGAALFIGGRIASRQLRQLSPKATDCGDGCGCSSSAKQKARRI